MNIMGSYIWGYMVYEPLFEACIAEDRSYTTYGTSIDTWASSGEYILTQWIPGGKVRIERNPDYVRADDIKLGAIEYSVIADSNTALELFEAGELDRLDLLYQQWQQYEEDPRVKLYYDDSVTYLFINNGNPNNNGLLANLNFRKAVYYGIDRVEFGEILGGAPNSRIYRRSVVAEKLTGKSILEVPVTWADDPYTIFDKAKSNELLAKAFEECKISNAELEVYYSEGGTHTRSSVEIFHKQVNANFPGIKMNIRAVPAALAWNLRKWNPDDPNAYEFTIGSVLPSNGPLDTMKFWDPDFTTKQFYWDNMPEARDKFAALYDQATEANQLGEEAKVVDLCLQMEEIIVKEIYIRIPVYELPSKMVFSERVKLPVKEYINSYGFGEYYAVIVK